MRTIFAAAMLSLLPCMAFGADASGISIYTAQGIGSTELTASGRALAMNTAAIGSRLSGAIVAWGKNDKGEDLNVGMFVKAGQPLFTIDPRTYKVRADAAHAALDSAQAALDDLVAPMRPERLAVLRASVDELTVRAKNAEKDEARYRQLVEVDKTVPIKRLEDARADMAQFRDQLKSAQARLDEALAGPTATQIAMAKAHVAEAQAAVAGAELDLKDTVVVAPFGGVITSRQKSLGDYILSAPFVEVLTLTSVDNLEAELRLPESYLPFVKPGETTVQLRSPLMKTSQELPVTRVVPEIDPQRGTFCVRVAVPPDKRSGLTAGAFVTADLKMLSQSKSVVVPQNAIVYLGGKPSVLVVSDGKMVGRPVELGDKLTENYIVKSGIAPGEKIVVGPPELVHEGATVPPELIEK